MATFGWFAALFLSVIGILFVSVVVFAGLVGLNDALDAMEEMAESDGQDETQKKLEV